MFPAITNLKCWFSLLKFLFMTKDFFYSLANKPVFKTILISITSFYNYHHDLQDLVSNLSPVVFDFYLCMMLLFLCLLRYL